MSSNWHCDDKNCICADPASPAPVGDGWQPLGGWKLVPVEITGEMIANVMQSNALDHVGITYKIQMIWKAALAASPAPVGDGLVTVPKLLVDALEKWIHMQSGDNSAELYNQAHKFFKLPWVDPDE